MADETKVVPVRLFGPEGGDQLADAEYEDTGAGQPLVIEHGGQTYVWNQRNSQYRQVDPVKAGKPKVTAAGIDTAEGASKAEQPKAAEAPKAGTK